MRSALARSRRPHTESGRDRACAPRRGAAASRPNCRSIVEQSRRAAPARSSVGLADDGRVQEARLRADADRRGVVERGDAEIGENARSAAAASRRLRSRSPRLLPSAIATGSRVKTRRRPWCTRARGRRRLMRCASFIPSTGRQHGALAGPRRRCGGRAGPRIPTAACSNRRWCSSDSPRMTSSMMRWRACVMRATRGRHRSTNAPRCRASSSRMPRNAPALDLLARLRRSAGTGSAVDGGGQRRAELGERVLQPREVRLLAVDDVLVGVVEIVVADGARAGFVALQQRQPIGGELGEELLEFGPCFTWSLRLLLFLAGDADARPGNGVAAAASAIGSPQSRQTP